MYAGFSVPDALVCNGPKQAVLLFTPRRSVVQSHVRPPFFSKGYAASGNRDAAISHATAFNLNRGIASSVSPLSTESGTLGR